MALSERPFPVGREMEPDEKEQENTIEFFLEVFRGYIAHHVDYKDLMFFRYFSPEQRKHFRSQAKIKDGVDVIGEMVDAILLMKDKPDRYTSLVNLFEHELENEKVLHILKGEKMPSNSGLQKEKIQKVLKAICDNLVASDIIPSLEQHKLIVSRDKEYLLKMERNSSNFDAALELMLILPNRHEHWYSIFLWCLVESKQGFLAKRIDKALYKIIKEKQKKLGTGMDSLTTDDQNEFYEFLEDYGEKSLIPVASPPTYQNTSWSSEETHVKDYYKGELKLDENTQCKQIIQSEETAAKKIYDESVDLGTMEAQVLTDKKDPSLSVNNLSPYKPEKESMLSVDGPDSVRRSLDENLDSHLTFNSLLIDTENTRVQGQAENSLNSGERSYGTDGSGNGSSLGTDLSFENYLQNMDESNTSIANRQRSLMSNNPGEFSQVKRNILENPKKFQDEIHKFQDEANLDRQLKALGPRRKLIRTGQFELQCIKCNHFICWSDDVKRIEGSHHVVIDKHLGKRVTFVKSGSTGNQEEVGKIICKECGGNLGVICIYKTLEFPVPKIENFLTIDMNGRPDICDRWKSAPFVVSPLTNGDWREILKAKKENRDL